MIQPKPSFLRKYIYEYALIVLTAAVGLLFAKFESLNTYIRTTQAEQNKQMIEALSKSTNVTEQFLNFQHFNNENSNSTFTLRRRGMGSISPLYPNEKKLFDTTQSFCRANNAFRFLK